MNPNRPRAPGVPLWGWAGGACATLILLVAAVGAGFVIAAWTELHGFTTESTATMPSLSQTIGELKRTTNALEKKTTVAEPLSTEINALVNEVKTLRADVTRHIESERNAAINKHQLVSRRRRHCGNDDDDSSSSDDDNDANKQQRRGCKKLKRLWPADPACPPAEDITAFIDLLATEGLPGVDIPLQTSPGFQVAYYSPLCGLFTHERGERNVSASLPMTRETIVPVASDSKKIISMALWKLVRRLDSLSYDTPLSRFIGEDELFSTSRVTVNNILTAPRAPYDNTGRNPTTGDCTGGSGIGEFFTPDIFLPDGTPISTYVPTPNATQIFLDFFNDAGSHRDQCIDQINSHSGMQAILAQRVTGCAFSDVIDHEVFADEALCGVRAVCPSAGTAPSSLRRCDEDNDDFSLIQLLPQFGGVTISNPAERQQYFGAQCYASALDLLKVHHGLLDNGFLRDDERQVFEASFAECSTLFNASDESPTNCQFMNVIFGGSSNHWGMVGLVRIPDEPFMAPDIVNHQTTSFLGAIGSTTVRYDALGSYMTFTQNGRGSIPPAFVFGATLRATMPMFDPTPERFVPDSTSSLHEPSLGVTPTAQERAATLAAFRANTLTLTAEFRALSNRLNSEAARSVFETNHDTPTASNARPRYSPTTAKKQCRLYAHERERRCSHHRIK